MDGAVWAKPADVARATMSPKRNRREVAAEIARKKRMVGSDGVGGARTRRRLGVKGLVTRRRKIFSLSTLPLVNPFTAISDRRPQRQAPAHHARSCRVCVPPRWGGV